MKNRFNEILTSDSFNDFNEKQEHFGKFANNWYSYLGINYSEDTVSSFKFYYTYFDISKEENSFPIKELFPHFIKYKNQFSTYHMNTPNIPGCGVTFTIKFDVFSSKIVKGVYFRVSDNASKYIKKILKKLELPVDDYKNKFDNNSYLKYIEIDQLGNVHERNYVYCLDPIFLNKHDQTIGISFSSSEWVEISSDLEDEETCNNIKLIAITTNKITSSKIDSDIQKTIKNLENDYLNNNDLFLIHGHYLEKKINSVFIFQTSNSNTKKSLVASIKDPL